MSSLPHQTFASPGRPLYQPFGTGGSAFSTFTDASISSLTVSSINGLPADQLDSAAWAFFPAATNVDFDGFALSNVSQISTTLVRTDNIIVDNTVNTTVLVANGINTNNLTAFSNINGVRGGFSTITASTITANTLIALSTVSAVSTISTTVVNTQAINNLSSINGLAFSTLLGSGDWSLFPAISSINIAGYDMLNVADLYSESNQPIYITTNGNGSIIFRTSNTQCLTLNPDQSALFSSNLQVNGIFSTPEIIVSSINGSEFTPGTINVSSLNTDSIQTGTMSSLVSYVGQQLVSTIQFNPSVNISPQFNIDLNMGGFLTALGTGLFGVAVAVPVTAGTITYGLVKGLASLFEPRPINNINSNVFETFNYASQLQVSTLGEYVSTIYRLTSTIPSTIVINANPTFSTVSQTNVEIFVSTLSQSSTPTCIRALGDPVQIVSTPWTVFQGFGEWAELPSTLGGGGGLSSNVSTLNLSTLFMLPSTVLQCEPSIGGILRILEPDLVNLGQLEIQGVNIKNDINTASDGIYTGLSGTPYWLDENFSSFILAYESKPPLAFYVSPAGNDGYATGSINNPYKTIQAAITAAEAVSSGTNQAVVMVAPGQYNENLTFNKGYVTVMGDLNTQDGNQITSLNGDITVNCGFSDDIVARQVILQGLQIDGRLTDTSPNQHTLIIQDCKFFDTDTIVLVNPSAANQRTFITNSEFVQTGVSTNPCLQFNVGQVQLERVDIDNSTNNTVLLYVTGTATMARCNFGNFESGTTNSGSGVAPIVSVDSSSASVHTFGYTNIYYTSASNKTGTANATGILFTTNLTMTAVVINCVFTLVGTSDAANQFIMKPFGGGIVVLSQADNQSSPASAGTCTKISPAFVRADYVIPSMTAGLISSTQIVTSSITGNVIGNVLGNVSGTTGSFSNVVGSNSGLFGSITASNSATLSNATITNLDLNSGNLALSQELIGTTGGGIFMGTFSNLASPSAIYTAMYNLDSTPGLREKAAIYMCGFTSSIGINKLPDVGYVLDVEKSMRVPVGHFPGQIFTSSIVASNTFVELKSATGEVALTPAGGSFVGVNSGVVAGDAQGTIRFGQSEVQITGYIGNETYIANQYYPASYNAGWTNYTGRAVRVEYATTIDSSFSGGLGKADFVLPIGFSTLASMQATYIAFQDTSPGLTHPTWLYSTIADANGQISTIQVGGGQNTDVYISVLGYV